MTYFLGIFCVVSIAIGQLLFKLTANSLAQAGTIFNGKTFLLFIAAIALYGFTTLLWIYVLQKGSLGKIYPIMALSFVIVPILSYVVLGERFNSQYAIGVVFLISGIIISIRS